MISKFPLEYTISKVHENRVGLKLNETHQLLAYADDVNLLEDNIDTTEKNIQTLVEASTEVALGINVLKPQYMLLYRLQSAGQVRDIKAANRSFENVLQFKYLGMTARNQNLIQEEIKSRLNSGNAYYHSVQILISSHLLSKNINIRICKIMILPVVLYGCETWSLTIRKEHRLRVLVNRVLRRVFGPKRDEVTER
jgi:hypothetical protein